MAGDGDRAEEAEVKAWLTRLLEASGLTKAQLARELRVEPKTIYNAFSPKASLPRGLTFFRLLKELGALRDPAPGVSVFDRLESISTQVANQEAALLKALAALQAAIDAQATPRTEVGENGG